MAKQGNIKHYRQEGPSKIPAALPYGEIAIAKDGTIFAGNEAGTPVQVALPARTEYHTLTAAGWTAQEDGTSTQVITLTGTTIVGDPPIYVGETPTGMTAELLEAISAAKLLATAHTGTTVTVTAFGTPPEADVPIFVTISD